MTCAAPTPTHSPLLCWATAFFIPGFNVRKSNDIYEVQIGEGTIMYYVTGAVYFEGRHCMNLQKVIFQPEFIFFLRQLTARSNSD